MEDVVVMPEDGDFSFFFYRDTSGDGDGARSGSLDGYCSESFALPP